MKYIMLKRRFAGCEQLIPIIFPNELVHQHVARALLSALGPGYSFIDKVESAGEVQVHVSVEEDSFSDTLNLGPASEDQGVINGFDYLHGL